MKKTNYNLILATLIVIMTILSEYNQNSILLFTTLILTGIAVLAEIVLQSK